MLHGYRICDADPHAIMSPARWRDLLEEWEIDFKFDID